MDWAHVHLMLNHIPVIGTGIGMLLLIAAFARHSTELRTVACVVLAGAAILAVPVYLTGEPAEHRVEHLAGVSEAIIERHEDAAQVALIMLGVAGTFAAGVLLSGQAPRRAHTLAMAVLATSLVTSILMARAANLGGQIRHSELRGAGTPATAAATDD